MAKTLAVNALFLLASALTFSSALVLGAMTPAVACSCVEAPLESQVKSADVVVSGKFTHLETTKGEMTNLYQVEVDRIYKGSTRKQVLMVSSMSQSAACGWSGTKGEQVLFFLSEGEDAMLMTNLCSGTTESPTPEKIAQLETLVGPGVEPTATPDGSIKPQAADKSNEVLSHSAVKAVTTGGALLFVALICISSYRIIYRRIIRK